MTGIMLRSTAFNDHAMIPHDYSHEAGDRSPELEWTGTPEGTAELALICEDPDAPRGTFTHWLAAGIAPDVEQVAAGTDPQGATLGRNDYGERGYGGPHPPAGDSPHRYFFHVYALADHSRLPEGFTAEDFHRCLQNADVLASGTLVGTYGR
ncbi:YbhB/YbcL family Raf kinase inhibitor-like protein [Nonomuraea sp. NN258]|uniref:YbhB/YbcL family Raf kinase inhibitor-like protein n=1 Tax=Nonomuraea antri TaxID=2730852 RepID=UPI001568E4AF|nr:YbhB/YbcL family Raf kinase inhibitor-like protein [Nonomuraea antri]NRQ37907.1 YbhB/YbcL family Raf kinase inhibitor-like protein [Nonomuraea antri]